MRLSHCKLPNPSGCSNFPQSCRVHPPQNMCNVGRSHISVSNNQTGFTLQGQHSFQYPTHVDSNNKQQRRSATARDDYRSDDRPRTKLQVDTKTKDQRLPRHSKNSNTKQRGHVSSQGGCTSSMCPTTYASETVTCRC